MSKIRYFNVVLWVLGAAAICMVAAVVISARRNAEDQRQRQAAYWERRAQNEARWNLHSQETGIPNDLREEFSAISSRNLNLNLKPKDTSEPYLSNIFQQESTPWQDRGITRINSVSFAWFDGAIVAYYIEAGYKPGQIAYDVTVNISAPYRKLLESLNYDAEPKAPLSFATDPLNVSFDGIKPGVPEVDFRRRLRSSGAINRPYDGHESWTSRDGWRIYWSVWPLGKQNEWTHIIQTVSFSDPRYVTF